MLHASALSSIRSGRILLLFQVVAAEISMNYIVIRRVSKVIQYIMGRVVMLFNTL